MIHYSEPYQVKGKEGWKIDKFSHGKKVQTIDVWTEKLAWDFLRTVNIYVQDKLCYSGI